MSTPRSVKCARPAHMPLTCASVATERVTSPSSSPLHKHVLVTRSLVATRTRRPSSPTLRGTGTPRHPQARDSGAPTRPATGSFLVMFLVGLIGGGIWSTPPALATTPPSSCANAHENVTGGDDAAIDSQQGIYSYFYYYPGNDDCARVSSILVANADGYVEVGWHLGWDAKGDNVNTGSVRAGTANTSTALRSSTHGARSAGSTTVGTSPSTSPVTTRRRPQILTRTRSGTSMRPGICLTR